MRARWQSVAVCVALVAAVWAVFGQTRGFEFINFDDNEYVYDNPPVKAGLTGRGVVWAFTHSHSANWHPLTWISHMLDCQLYGLNAGGHHLTNVALHAATAVLLFLVLRAMTGALWRSAFVATVFAIHPLRVESVAWIAERKDVLSGLFFMLTLWAYMRYAHGPSLRRYLPVALLFALGLMAKPSLVTLPCVLLLLDYWPLGRFQPGVTGATTLRRLFLEKIPLLALSAASGVVTTLVQGQAIGRFEVLPMGLRLENAVVSYAVYIVQVTCPARLAVAYPYPLFGLPLWEVSAAAALLAAVSAAVWKLRAHRWLPVGWLWYLGTLVPMIGLVQVGYQAHADRYTYLSQIGLYIMVAWGAAELAARWRGRWVRPALGVGGAAILAALMVAAHSQAKFWQESERLWTHTLAVTPPRGRAENSLAMAILQKGRVDEALARFRSITQRFPAYTEGYFNLAFVLMQQGQREEAIGCYRKVLELHPQMAEAHNNLGLALAQKGEWPEALAHFLKALEIEPDLVNAHNNLGLALSQQGKTDGAMAEWQKALELDPSYVKARLNLASALMDKGRIDEAIEHYRKVIESTPNDARVHFQLGQGLARKGQAREAVGQFEKALVLQPANDVVLNELAWTLATCPDAAVRNGPKALELAQKAAELSGGKDAPTLDTLAAAQAECGNFDAAVESAQRALAMAGKKGADAGLARGIRERLELYRKATPYRVPR
jgi:protein O-mannosyl-transferase